MPPDAAPAARRRHALRVGAAWMPVAVQRRAPVAVTALLWMVVAFAAFSTPVDEPSTLPPGRNPSPGMPWPQDPVPPVFEGPLATAPPMRFGLDADTVNLQEENGVAPEYGTLWVGVWNLEKGWRDTDLALRELADQGMVPAVHFYYWGDDISPDCLRDGCNGKTQAGWDRLADELTLHLQDILGGGPVLVVLETEFNKAALARHEGLDLLLADKARALKAGYPATQVVLGIGNWNPAAWETWDRAAAASDAVGLQALVGTPGAAEDPTALYARTLAGAVRLDELFGKPIIIQDLAVASGPDPASAARQEEVLASFASGLEALKQAGVEAILYRSFVDNPSMALSNYFGEAERHFGLAEADSGKLKPAGAAWVALMAAERGQTR